MSFNRKKVGVIGAGAMGSAITRGFLKAGILQPKDVTASDPKKDALQRLQEDISVKVTSDNSTLVQRSEVVIIAVKPNQVEEILKEIAPFITLKHLVVSVAAGIRISTLEKHLPAGVSVIRVMPNVPALIGEGMSALALGAHAGKDESTGSYPELLIGTITQIHFTSLFTILSACSTRSGWKGNFINTSMQGISAM
jgi:pyrroline-5-carboxylate reductase